MSNRNRLLTLGCAGGLVLAPGCKKSADPKPAEATTARSAAPSDSNGTREQKVEKPAGAGCDLPENFDHDFTIKKGCDIRVEGVISLAEGTVLTIEPGVKLRFSSGGGLMVGTAKLLVQGTEQEPVLFTSASKTPAAGDWNGIVLAGNTTKGTVIDHAIVEYAGHQGSWDQAAIIIAGDVGPDRISILHTLVQKSEKVGLADDTRSTFTRFEGNTFKDVPTAMVVAADLLGNMGQNTFGAPIRVSGTVTRSGSWPATDQPYLFDSGLLIEGKDEAATLTLPDKVVLKFADGNGFVLGNGAGSGLVARNATFTSVNKDPNPGDWAGITLLEKAKNLTLENVSIAFAGHGDSWGEGALRIDDQPALKNKQIALKNVSFTKLTGGAALRMDPDACKAFADAALGNKTDGSQPLCGKKE
jgi:hypothetical protein